MIAATFRSPLSVRDNIYMYTHGDLGPGARASFSFKAGEALLLFKVSEVAPLTFLKGNKEGSAGGWAGGDFRRSARRPKVRLSFSRPFRKNQFWAAGGLPPMIGH